MWWCWGEPIIGDRSWLVGLGYGYQQHLADSARYDREPQPFERWAVSKTWPYFVRLARLCEIIPEYTIDEWATANPVPGVNGNGYSATVLARRLIDGLVLTRSVMNYIRCRSDVAHGVVRGYLKDGRVYPGHERALAKGKRLVWDYLKHAAETEKALA